ncbi:MAG: hypothetical protein U5N26_11080 [Candidatus Marinimicrobia bacterium]|nr:hypothetical protein [Candidatus Neomarinimicrobiota bacterium]
MPVAAREASVYTATTLGECYRQMGLDVLVLADSSIPLGTGDARIVRAAGRDPQGGGLPGLCLNPDRRILRNVFPDYVELPEGSYGSMTIGGTVSPAGGNLRNPLRSPP